MSVLALVSQPWLESANDRYMGKIGLLKTGSCTPQPQVTLGLKDLVRMSLEEPLGYVSASWPSGGRQQGSQAEEMAARHWSAVAGRINGKAHSL